MTNNYGLIVGSDGKDGVDEAEKDGIAGQSFELDTINKGIIKAGNGGNGGRGSDGKIGEDSNKLYPEPTQGGQGGNGGNYGQAGTVNVPSESTGTGIDGKKGQYGFTGNTSHDGLWLVNFSKLTYEPNNKNISETRTDFVTDMKWIDYGNYTIRKDLRLGYDLTDLRDDAWEKRKVEYKFDDESSISMDYVYWTRDEPQNQEHHSDYKQIDVTFTYNTTKITLQLYAQGIAKPIYKFGQVNFKWEYVGFRYYCLVGNNDVSAEIDTQQSEAS